MSFKHQDWETVVIKKKRNNKKKVSDYERANGTGTVTVSKYNGGKNSQSFKSGMTKVQRDALNNDGTPNKIKTVDRKISQNIQSARAKLGMNRKELARLTNQPVSVIADYENGKAIPNAGLINKMEKVLKTKLRK